jgi:hypothetical protein
VKTVADTLEVARSNIIERQQEPAELAAPVHLLMDC